MTKGTKFKLPSASKAGMQKKQGRNFLLPKEKPKRGMITRPPKPNPEDFPNFKRPKPMPKATNTSAQTRAKVADLKKQIKKLMGQYK